MIFSQNNVLKNIFFAVDFSKSELIIGDEE